eukprot:5284739-Alexandrium_andersonii.AAC.1
MLLDGLTQHTPPSLHDGPGKRPRATEEAVVTVSHAALRATMSTALAAPEAAEAATLAASTPIE